MSTWHTAFSLEKEILLPPLDSLAAINPHHDVHFVRALTPEDCVSKVTRLKQGLSFPASLIDPKTDLQILAPLHRGIGGIGELNDKLRDALNPTGATQVMGSFLFREGDKVIQTRNNYDKDVFNGDMGIIESVDTLNGTVNIDFEGKRVSYQRMETTDLQPAYAISVRLCAKEVRNAPW